MNKPLPIALALALALAFASTAALPLHATAAAPATAARSPGFDRKAYAINYKKFVLPNGLTWSCTKTIACPWSA